MSGADSQGTGRPLRIATVAQDWLDRQEMYSDSSSTLEVTKGEPRGSFCQSAPQNSCNCLQHSNSWLQQLIIHGCKCSLGVAAHRDTSQWAMAAAPAA